MEMKGYSIAKLTGNNYFMWQIKLQMVLQKEKLWHVIENDPPDPITDTWRTCDQSARATLGLTLEDNVLVGIASCKTAKEVWMSLKAKYKHSGLTSKLFLLKKLYSIKFDTFGNMENYLNGIFELIERLRSIGENVKENHIVAIMLCGLPETYNPTITALETRDDGELKINYVAERLRDEAIRQEAQENPNEQLVMSMQQMRMKPKILCHLCGGEGHLRRNCPRNGSAYKNRQTTTGRRDEEESNYYSATKEWPTNSACGTNYQSEEAERDRSSEMNLEQEWALTGNTNQGCNKEGSWIIDSGATAHMTSDSKLFSEMAPLKDSIVIVTANGEWLKAQAIGKVKVHVIIIGNVLHVPNLQQNLLSVIALCNEGFQVSFTKQLCTIYKGDKAIGNGVPQGKIFVLKTQDYCYEQSLNCIHVWHERFGHRSTKSIEEMNRLGIVKDLNISKCQHDFLCESCQLGGMTKKHFNSSTSINRDPFSIIVSDVCGPITPASLGGNTYFLTLTDDASNYTQIYLMKRKSEATSHILQFLKQGFNRFKHMPEVLRTDGGGEYMGIDLKLFMNKHGIAHQVTVPRTPEQNGKAERKNRTLMTMARSMMAGTVLPLSLWGEAVNTACYISNRMKHSKLAGTPFEHWFGVLPTVKHLRIFGRKAYTFIDKSLRTKLDKTSNTGYLVGYGNNTKCYRIWTPGSRIITNSISTNIDETGISNVNLPGKKSDVIMELGTSDEQPKEVESQSDILNQDRLRRSLRCNKGVAPVKLTY